MVKGSLDLLPKRFTATRHQGKALSVAFTASLCHVYEHVTVGVEDNQDGGAFQKFLHYLSCVAAKLNRKREHTSASCTGSPLRREACIWMVGIFQ
jgi:hypothetical protein